LVVTNLVGGDPALDFANTLEGPRDGPPDKDWLSDYGDLAAWAAHAGVVDPPVAERLAAGAETRPREAAAALAAAHRLRKAVYDVFAAIASGREPAAAALAHLAAAHGDAVAAARIVRTGDSFDLGWDGDALDRPLWPLGCSAVDLLRAGPLDRVKCCAVCRWLFLDISRNRSRRWCSMSECGGRDKMRRYRARRATRRGSRS
jgi:predicted RNA-binding Zn ribbon-like protein